MEDRREKPVRTSDYMCEVSEGTMEKSDEPYLISYARPAGTPSSAYEDDEQCIEVRYSQE
jgi:hypothetical protein